MKKTLLIIFLGLFLIVSINVISAKTIVGGVIGFAGTGKGKFALVFMVAILAIGTFVVIKQKKKKSKKI